MLSFLPLGLQFQGMLQYTRKYEKNALNLVPRAMPVRGLGPMPALTYEQALLWIDTHLETEVSINLEIITCFYIA